MIVRIKFKNIIRLHKLSNYYYLFNYASIIDILELLMSILFIQMFFKMVGVDRVLLRYQSRIVNISIV